MDGVRRNPKRKAATETRKKGKLKIYSSDEEMDYEDYSYLTPVYKTELKDSKPRTTRNTKKMDAISTTTAEISMPIEIGNRTAKENGGCESFCCHYISLIEEKAQNYKLCRKLEQMEERILYLEEVIEYQEKNSMSDVKIKEEIEEPDYEETNSSKEIPMNSPEQESFADCQDEDNYLPSDSSEDEDQDDTLVNKNIQNNINNIDTPIISNLNTSQRKQFDTILEVNSEKQTNELEDYNNKNWKQNSINQENDVPEQINDKNLRKTDEGTEQSEKMEVEYHKNHDSDITISSNTDKITPSKDIDCESRNVKEKYDFINKESEKKNNKEESEKENNKQESQKENNLDGCQKENNKEEGSQKENNKEECEKENEKKEECENDNVECKKENKEKTKLENKKEEHGKQMASKIEFGCENDEKTAENRSSESREKFSNETINTNHKDTTEKLLIPPAEVTTDYDSSKNALESQQIQNSLNECENKLSPKSISES